LLTSSLPGASYLWYFNNAPISGATSRSYLATANGNYYVAITAAVNGCTYNSAVKTLPVASLNTTLASTSANSYCNGLIGDRLYIASVAGATKFNVRLEDANNPGTTVAKVTNATSTVTISTFVPALQYGMTYNAYVSCITTAGDTLCENSTYSTFGTVSQAAAPSTKLTSASCGKLNLVNTAGSLSATKVCGGENYQLVILDKNTNAVVATANSTAGLYTIATLGLAASTTYKAIINVTRDGVVTGPGVADTCLIGFKSNGGGSRTTGVEVAELAAYPNPFTNNTTLAFNLDNAARVSVAIVDLAGRTVANVSATEMTAGNQTIAINGDNMAAGVYVARLMVNGNLAGQVRLNVVK
jgi:hypothetical protein